MVLFQPNSSLSQIQQQGYNKSILTQGYIHAPPYYDRFVNHFQLPSPPHGSAITPPHLTQTPQLPSQGNNIIMPSSDIDQYFGGYSGQF